MFRLLGREFESEMARDAFAFHNKESLISSSKTSHRTSAIVVGLVVWVALVIVLIVMDVSGLVETWVVVLISLISLFLIPGIMMNIVDSELHSRKEQEVLKYSAEHKEILEKARKEPKVIGFFQSLTEPYSSKEEMEQAISTITITISNAEDEEEKIELNEQDIKYLYVENLKEELSDSGKLYEYLKTKNVLYTAEELRPDLASEIEQMRIELAENEVKEQLDVCSQNTDIMNLIQRFNDKHATQTKRFQNLPKLIKLLNNKISLDQTMEIGEISEESVRQLLWKNLKEGLSDPDRLHEYLEREETPFAAEDLRPDLIPQIEQIRAKQVEKLKLEKIRLEKELEIVEAENKEAEMLSETERLEASLFDDDYEEDEDDEIEYDDVENMTGYEFEEFIGGLFEGWGYSVDVTAKTGDQGADIVVKKDGKSTAIQTKRYKGKVGNSAIQAVAAAVKHYGCDEAMVMTTGTFTKSAIELAASNDVKLIDGEGLKELLSR